MEMTTEQKIESLLRLPWTLQPSWNAEEGYYVVRVAELPGAIATGKTEKEVLKNFWESLRETLAVLVENDDRIPLPARVESLPWDLPAVRPQTVRIIRGKASGSAWELSDVDRTELSSAVSLA